ncbi:MAG TPA: flagellar biosynthesis anti-sigma factor FlgM [Terriglobales bacterium]|nr:flagellar biosynthesis anti-sigma factor FlgM [Terriglobales bacterium]
MKVDLNSLNLNTSNLDRTTLTQAQHAARSATTEDVQGQDVIDFSHDNTHIQSLATQALANPAIRQDKVEALRQAIAGGTYVIEPETVAHAMMQDSLPAEP